MTADAAAAALAHARLYGILDLGHIQPNQVENVTAALCEGGVHLLQLRAKQIAKSAIEEFARAMHPITRDHGVPLIINDHMDIAAQMGSEGVHVGQDDAPLAVVRAAVGAGVLVGKSTHSLSQAQAAQAEGADYIGFGPLYATGTKPDYTPIGLRDIKQVHQLVTLPIFCIGGVNAERLSEIQAAGARRIVIVSAFLCAPDIRAAVREVAERL